MKYSSVFGQIPTSFMEMSFFFFWFYLSYITQKDIYILLEKKNGNVEAFSYVLQNILFSSHMIVQVYVVVQQRP